MSPLFPFPFALTCNYGVKSDRVCQRRRMSPTNPSSASEMVTDGPRLLRRRRPYVTLILGYWPFIVLLIG